MNKRRPDVASILVSSSHDLLPSLINIIVNGELVSLKISKTSIPIDLAKDDDAEDSDSSNYSDDDDDVEIQGNDAEVDADFPENSILNFQISKSTIPTIMKSTTLQNFGIKANPFTELNASAGDVSPADGSLLLH